MYTCTTYNDRGDFIVTTSSSPPCSGIPPGVHDVFCKISDAAVELHIASLIKLLPHESLVSVYDVCGRNVFMEHLEVGGFPTRRIADLHAAVADYLAAQNVVYIDWKEDNVGYSHRDGRFKLFDFNMSGVLLHDDARRWAHAPCKGYNLDLIAGLGLDPTEFDAAIVRYLEHGSTQRKC